MELINVLLVLMIWFWYLMLRRVTLVDPIVNLITLERDPNVMNVMILVVHVILLVLKIVILVLLDVI